MATPTIASVSLEDGTTVYFNPAFWTTAAAINPQTLRIEIAGADPIIASATIDQFTNAIVGIPSKQATPVGQPFGQTAQAQPTGMIQSMINAVTGLFSSGT